MCAGLYLYLHDGYEHIINVLFGERLLNFLFCRLLEWLVALSIRGSLHMVSERGYNFGAVGPSTDL